MTKKLEETFNISAEDEEETNTPTIEESQEITELLNTEIENTEKIDAALPVVTDLNEHDREMDDIHAKALKTFEDLLQCRCKDTRNCESTAKNCKRGKRQ